MIGAFVKWYRVPFDYVLYDLSYANLVLYGAVIPSYDSDDSKKDGKRFSSNEVIDSRDPRNKERLYELFSNMK